MYCKGFRLSSDLKPQASDTQEFSCPRPRFQIVHVHVRDIKKYHVRVHVRAQRKTDVRVRVRIWKLSISVWMKKSLENFKLNFF